MFPASFNKISSLYLSAVVLCSSSSGIFNCAFLLNKLYKYISPTI